MVKVKNGAGREKCTSFTTNLDSHVEIGWELTGPLLCYQCSCRPHISIPLLKPHLSATVLRSGAYGRSLSREGGIG